MIIISGKSGQLANSLVLYANWLAYGWRTGTPIYNPSFYRYNHYFDFTRQQQGGKSRFMLYYWLTRLLIRLGFKHGIIKALHIDWEERINIDEWPQEKGKVVFVQGWLYRADESVRNYREWLLKEFKPLPDILNVVDRFMGKFATSGNRMNMAIHVRRGDYKNFEGGRYFYDDDQYIALMKKAQQLWQDKELRFLIFSNENIDLAKFQSFGFEVHAGPGTDVTDLYSIARCDAIIGPPSTFTMWASFYGSVPLYMVHDAGLAFTKEDFKIQQHF